jgi:hypothetical protein
MALDVFREMTVEGSPEQLLAFIEDVSKRLTDGWRRNLPAEADTFGDDPRYAFTCDVDDVRGRAGATIHIMQQDDAALRVMNIVPTVNVALEFLGYNRILVEFHDAFAKPAAEVLGLELSLTDDLYRLEDHISPKTHDQLRAFSREANRGVPFASDQERWRRALLSLHAEGWPVDSEMMARWLVEDEGWLEDRAWELGTEVALARYLLQEYDLVQGR